MVTILFPWATRWLSKGFLFMMIIFCIGGFSSCNVSKPERYFEGLTDSTIMANIVIPDQLIQKGDMLSIRFHSDNSAATLIYNQAGGSSDAISLRPVAGNEVPASTSGGGYLVDNYGKIRMHAMGEILVEGLTIKQLEELLIRKILEMGVLTNPYCVIRFSNFKITVLGEVSSPGVYTIPSGQASILEVIGLAGDINNFGRREDIMLIREEQGKRSYVQIDLTDPKILSSPNFYMRQNDVVIVQPDKRKQTPADIQTIQYVTILFSVVSVITIVANSFR